MDNILQNLDYDQRFEEIDIQLQDETIKLKNVNFEESMNRLQDILNEMSESKFYKKIKVHFGAKTKEETSYLEQHYNKKLQVLKHSLTAEKEHLKNIFAAKKEEDIELAKLQYRRNQLNIKKYEESVKNPNYYPCIYVQADKKGPIFGSIQQEISRHGAGTFGAQLGYRSPLHKFDILQFNFQYPVQRKLSTKYYQFGVSWTNPIKHTGDFSVKYSLGNDQTYQNMDTHTNGFTFGLQKESKRYEIEVAHRVPFLYKNFMKQIAEDYYHPSTKCSFKFSNVLINSLKYNSVTEGTYAQCKTQLGLPFFSETQFLRLQYSHRHFYDTFPLRKYFKNDLIRKLFWRSTIQTNASASTVFQYGRRHFVNDLLETIDVRGFQQYKKPVSSYLNLKGSVKFNLHNYPLIHQANLVSFLYGNWGLSFLKNERVLNPYLMTSSGLGFSFNFGAAQIQFLCNLAQYQNKQLRDPSRFQFRFSVND